MKKLSIKSYLCLLLCLVSLGIFTSCSKKHETKPEESKEFIREVFRNVIEDMHATEATVGKYFSKEYVQYVDGEMLDYDDFVAHMKAQKKALKSVNVRFKHIIVEDDKVATVHTIDAIKNDGSTIKAQINALFQIKNGKLVLCDELTHMSQCEESDKDLGSIK